MSYESIAEEACERLRKNKDLLKAGCDVMLDDKADIDAVIRGALGKMGLCAVVVDDGADNDGESGGANPTLKAKLTVMVYESPLFNRKKANHLKLPAAARAVAGELHVYPALPSGHLVLKRISGTTEESGTGVVWRAVTFEIETNLKG